MGIADGDAVAMALPVARPSLVGMEDGSVVEAGRVLDDSRSASSPVAASAAGRSSAWLRATIWASDAAPADGDVDGGRAGRGWERAVVRSLATGVSAWAPRPTARAATTARTRLGMVGLIECPGRCGQQSL
jgi:hypothetical protein